MKWVNLSRRWHELAPRIQNESAAEHARLEHFANDPTMLAEIYIDADQFESLADLEGETPDASVAAYFHRKHS